MIDYLTESLPVTLEQLRIFLAVAEHSHFTNAADALYLLSPPLVPRFKV